MRNSSREDILRQFAARLGAPNSHNDPATPNYNHTSNNNHNKHNTLASLLHPNNTLISATNNDRRRCVIPAATVKLPCLSNNNNNNNVSSTSTRLARPLRLGRSTVDAAPMLLHRNISCAFADSIDARLRDWIHMLRRYLMAQTDADADSSNTNSNSNRNRNSVKEERECREARVLRALHSIAFSIKIVTVTTMLRTSSSSAGVGGGEEKKATEDDDELQSTMTELPLVFDVEVVLSILGQKSVVTLSAPGIIGGLFCSTDTGTTTDTGLLLNRVEVDVDTAALLSSMRQQARMVVRRAASLKMSPEIPIAAHVVDVAVVSDVERPLTPVMYQGQGQEHGQSNDRNGSTKTTATVSPASTTLSMPPPPPRTPLQLPMVSPTASDANACLINDVSMSSSPGSSGIIALPMPSHSHSRRKTPLLTAAAGNNNHNHNNNSSTVSVSSGEQGSALKIKISEAHRISPPTASHAHAFAHHARRVQSHSHGHGHGPALKKQKVVAPIPELRVDRW